MTASDRILQSRRILVVAEDFPSRIQPWMLNTTVQAIRHGAQVFIAAGGRRGESHQADVERHHLLDRTIYVNPTKRRGVLAPFSYLVGASADLRAAARRGLARALFEPESLRPSAFAKGVALAVPMGISGLSLIHAHPMIGAYEFLRVARARRVPMVMTFHGLPPAGVPDLASDKQQQLFREADRFLVNTQFALGQLTSLGCPEDKIRILPQGTNLGEFPFHPKPAPARGTVRFLTVGRLHEDKGHAFALRALATFAKRGSPFEYRIVGVGPDRALLERQVAELGLEGQVTFLGEVDDAVLRREYQEAHIFILPSLRDLRGKHEETQGVVIQEAQASGCLVIATTAGGIPECVNPDHARLVPDRDADAIGRAIDEMVGAPARWSEWQTAGRRWVESRYSIDVIGDRLAALYADLIRGASVRG